MEIRPKKGVQSTLGPFKVKQEFRIDSIVATAIEVLSREVGWGRTGRGTVRE